MNKQIVDHLNELIREAQSDGADEDLIGDPHQLLEQVRNGKFRQPTQALASDPDYKSAFEYILGVTDGLQAAEFTNAAPPKISAADPIPEVDEGDDDAPEGYDEDDDEDGDEG